MAAATGAGGLMRDVEARAVTEGGYQDTILDQPTIVRIQEKLQDVENLRNSNESIEHAINEALPFKVSDAQPIIIRLSQLPDFTTKDIVIIYKAGLADIHNQSIFAENVFTVSSVDRRSNKLTIDVHSYNPNADPGKVEEAIKTYLGRSNAYNWTDPRSADKGSSVPILSFSVPLDKCALVTRYSSHPNQLVIVFGPEPTTGSAGGAKRKRVISRKLKSLNKKRKYTQRRFRRRYSYKGGRKN